MPYSETKNCRYCSRLSPTRFSSSALGDVAGAISCTMSLGRALCVVGRPAGGFGAGAPAGALGACGIGVFDDLFLRRSSRLISGPEEGLSDPEPPGPEEPWLLPLAGAATLRRPGEMPALRAPGRGPTRMKWPTAWISKSGPIRVVTLRSALCRSEGANNRWANCSGGMAATTVARLSPLG